MHSKRKQLLQTLGAYDDNARLNQKNIARCKTQLYNRQIYLTERVETWTDEVFQPRVFNAEFLSHPALNDNPMFRQIRDRFGEYNKQVSDPSSKTEQQHIKYTKMAELLNLMTNILEIDDKKNQQKALRKTYEWMKRNFKVTPDKYQSLKNNAKSSSPSKTLELPKIPSDYTQQQVKDFKDRMRTFHRYLYAPQDRIRQYKRRQLNFDDSIRVAPKKEVAKAPEPKINKIKYVKPEAQFDFGIQQQRHPQENLEDPLITPGPGADIPAVEEPVVEFQAALGQQDELEPELPEEDENAGKLNPRVKNYTYPDPPNYEKSQTILKKHFELEMVEQQKQLRQDRDNESSMRKYAERKGRFESQVRRKLESLREVAKLSRLNKTTKLRSVTEMGQYPVKNLSQYRTQTSIPEAPFEERCSRQIVKSVKKNVSNSICFTEGDLPNARQGLSMYGKKKRQQQSRKWLSIILNDHQSKEELQQQLDELERVKFRLSQNRVPFQIKKICGGLLKPTDLSTEQLSALGHPEKSLLSNPDFKVGKKKKKKRRK